MVLLVLVTRFTHLGMADILVLRVTPPDATPLFTVLTVGSGGFMNIMFLPLRVVVKPTPLSRNLHFGRMVRVFAWWIVLTTPLTMTQDRPVGEGLTRIVLLVTCMRSVPWLVLEQMVMAVTFTPPVAPTIW